MRLDFIYLPVSDLQGALALYRDQLGFDELWREGEGTVGLGIPGTDTGLMIDADAAPGSGPGPIFGVESVDAWLAGQDGLDVVFPPSEIPGGHLMGFRDVAGNHVYVLDQAGA
jgi:catechol 2,3-dioxygenase-like lactoylglutathione lyase family enzyme